MSQVHGKVLYRRPEMVTADLKNLVVTTPLNREERYQSALSSSLREALCHHKGNEFVPFPVTDEDWCGGYLGHLFRKEAR